MMQIRRRLRELFNGRAAPEAPRRIGSYEPIEDYAVIGDRVSLALVSRRGSIDWACFPRMDSPSVFARILDAGKGGYWSIAPAETFKSTRRYLPDTNVLETTFTTPDGVVTVTDFMPPPGVEFERLGDSSIVRIVQGVSGEVRIAMHFEPRFDYARATTQWSQNEGIGVRAAHFDQALTLYSGLPMKIEGEAATASVTIAGGERVVLAASFRRPGSLIWRQGVDDVVDQVLRDTEHYWRAWMERCRYEGPHSDLVRRSALVMRLLDYAPTGAIAAAGTTSLPETIGGIRNWDYRYSWIRDAAFTLHALFALGYPEEGATYLSWILDMTRGQPRSLKVLYGIGGEQENVEFELQHLEGYRGSRPVRVGNGAQNQRQLDIYGELLDSALMLCGQGGTITEDLWELLRAAVDYVCEVWREPDYGLWEVRSQPRHFVYSKVLCWVTLDRGLRLAEICGYECDRERWETIRDEIRAEVLDKGYSEKLGSFTQAYGHDDLDAALLALPLRHFIDAADPKMVGTIRRIRAELTLGENNHLLARVSREFEDGLHGREGAFVLCSFWLVDCLTELGEVEEATRMFDRLCGYANDVGLYSEMVDPKTGAHLGNFPQAFAHVALVNAAVRLKEATARG
jgi:GH15 family glucan-1,4-alpha-glucosidase